MTQEPTPGYFDLESLAAQLRRQSDDLSLYATFLLDILSAALPGEIVTVRREGRLKARFAGRAEPAVLAIAVDLGQRLYQIERSEYGRPLVASIRHQSGGVVLSTKAVTIDEWSRGMAQELAGLAGSNAAAAEVLARLTML